MNQMLTYWLWPYICILCRSRSTLKMDLCHACQQDLPYLPKQSGDSAIFAYQFPINKMIHQFKFAGKQPYGRVLGTLFAEKLAHNLESLPDCIIPVPLHPHRQKERGFNQSQLLANIIGKRLQIPVEIGLCIRSRDTMTQSNLSKPEREDNLKGAFAVKKRVLTQLLKRYPSLSVAIVDDVVTTGRTVASLTKTLHLHGIQKVSYWSLSQTE